MNLLELSLFELNVMQFIKVCVSIGFIIYTGILFVRTFTSITMDILHFIYRRFFKED